MTLTAWNYDPVRTFEIGAADRRYERKIRVYADNLHSEEEVVAYLASQGIRLGAALPENSSAFIQSIRGETIAEQDKAWLVSLNYATSQAENDNPLLAPAEIEFGVVSYTARVERTVDNEPIVNSAGEPFDEPPEVEFNRPMVRITRNESYQSFLDRGVYLTYQDVVNSDPFMFANPGEAKMASVSGRYFVFNGSKYVAASYEIHFKQGGWKVRPLDQGYSIKEDGFTRKTNGRWQRAARTIAITNGDGTSLDKPKLLNGNGGLLPDDGSPVFLEFKVYQERPFSALGLPVNG